MTFAFRRLLRLLVRLEGSGGQLPCIASDCMAVLADEDDLALVRHRDEYDGPGMSHDLDIHLPALARDDRLDDHREDAPIEHLSDLFRYGRLGHVTPSRGPSTRAARPAPPANPAANPR